MDGEGISGIHQSHLFLAVETLLAQDVISYFIPLPACFHPFFGCLQRPVRGIMRQIHEHRDIGRMATDETDGRIRNGRCIIKVVGECRDTVRIRIDGSRGVIASAAAQATVIFIEPSLCGITTVRFIECALYCQMPFPTHIGRISVCFEDFGDSRVIGRYLSAVSGPVLVDSRHPSHSRFMLVTSGQEGGTAGATASGVFELAETHSVLCQKINVRSLNFSSVTSQI